MFFQVPRQVFVGWIVDAEPSAYQIADRFGLKFAQIPVPIQVPSIWPALGIRRTDVPTIQVRQFMNKRCILCFARMVAIQ